MNDYGDFGEFEEPSQTARMSKVWIWLLGGLGLFVLLPCGGLLGWILYAAAIGPDTSVYTSNQVPSRFIKTMKSVGALEDDETLIYFYSDAMIDIRDGFYFVSDKKLVIYSEELGDPPLTVIEFDEIVDLDIYSDGSFFNDSQIHLELDSGLPVSFPVSSEYGRDQQFFEAIQQRVNSREMELEAL